MKKLLLVLVLAVFLTGTFYNPALAGAVDCSENPQHASCQNEEPTEWVVVGSPQNCGDGHECIEVFNAIVAANGKVRCMRKLVPIQSNHAGWSETIPEVCKKTSNDEQGRDQKEDKVVNGGRALTDEPRSTAICFEPGSFAISFVDIARPDPWFTVVVFDPEGSIVATTRDRNQKGNFQQGVFHPDNCGIFTTSQMVGELSEISEFRWFYNGVLVYNRTKTPNHSEYYPDSFGEFLHYSRLPRGKEFSTVFEATLGEWTLIELFEGSQSVWARDHFAYDLRSAIYYDGRVSGYGSSPKLNPVSGELFYKPTGKGTFLGIESNVSFPQGTKTFAFDVTGNGGILITETGVVKKFSISDGKVLMGEVIPMPSEFGQPMSIDIAW